MRFLFFSLITLLTTSGINAQNTVRKEAVKANDFGVTYTLPKSAPEITIDYSKKTKTAGEFYKYAERYLSISDPIVENSVEYEINAIEAETVGIPDTKNTFLVELRPGTPAAYVTLTDDGMICAINTDYKFPEKAKETKVQLPKKALDARQYFTEEILRAGSSAKQAELVAKQIYKIRESRNDILTGDADNMPPDGDAYKLVMQQLDEQEAALTQLFLGKEEIVAMKKTIRIDLGDKEIPEMIVCRFSKKLGVVESNDLAGEAIYLSLKSREPLQPLTLSDKDAKEREKKFEKGIVYNIPGKATLQIEYNNKVYVNKECDVIQFGTQDVLGQKLFGDKNNPLKVVFHPSLGAIKQTGTTL